VRGRTEIGQADRYVGGRIGDGVADGWVGSRVGWRTGEADQWMEVGSVMESRFSCRRIGNGEADQREMWSWGNQSTCRRGTGAKKTIGGWVGKRGRGKPIHGWEIGCAIGSRYHWSTVKMLRS
jgi:hypothetical protein